MEENKEMKERLEKKHESVGKVSKVEMLIFFPPKGWVSGI